MAHNDDSIAHYSSQYYDPAKAHEYYMRNRELKGARSTKGMSDTQKEAWDYSKNQMGEAKKSELTSTQEAMMRRNEALRQQAKESAERITEKIRNAISQMQLKRETMSDAKLKELQSSSDRDKVQKLRASASAEIAKVQADLKTAIAKSRETYNQSKQQIKTKYDAAADKEYTNIKAQLPGAPPKAPAKKRGRKTDNGTPQARL